MDWAYCRSEWDDRQIDLYGTQNTTRNRLRRRSMELTMEFTLVRTGHPLSIVLMHSLATNLTGTLLRVGFGLVNAFTVRMAGQGIHNKDSNDGP